MIEAEELKIITQIESYQRTVEKKLRQLSSKIYETQGLIFKVHSYSIEDLLEDRTFKTIDGIINNISALVINWGYRSGNGYSSGFFSEYNRIKKEITESTENVGSEIARRRKTGWEMLKQGVGRVISFIVSKLPDIILNSISLPAPSTWKQKYLN